MSTYTPISSFTATTSISSVTIAGIPQNYTDLVLVVNGEVSTSQQIALQFNSDTGSNYSVTSLYGDGSSAASGRNSSTTSMVGGFGWFANGTRATSIINIQNYSNTTTNKTAIGRGNLSSAYVHAGVGLWRNTSAITSINMFVFGGYNWNSGATFNLYGIDASLSAQAKATGGTTIIRDNSYWYHVFTKSGTFAPTESITADVLVVAGGGSGGLAGGGGGAGGLRAFTSQVFAAQNHVVTVGAGGSNSSGSPTSISSLAVSGGGKGGANNWNGSPGGSGGGAGFAQGTTYTGGAGNAGGYSPVEGYAGGNTGTADLPGLPSSGGGGAGGVGTNAASLKGGNGGAGTQTYNSINFSTWLSATSQGVSGFLAGGGGGNCYFGNVGSNEVGLGGSGGGGRGAGQDQTSGVAGTISTGSGGGGSYNSTAGIGAGGSGIVIIRYAV